jgi:hypothetical protein
MKFLHPEFMRQYSRRFESWYVGQVANLRRIGNPPARCGSERVCVGGRARKVRQADYQSAAG